MLILKIMYLTFFQDEELFSRLQKDCWSTNCWFKTFNLHTQDCFEPINCNRGMKNVIHEVRWGQTFLLFSGSLTFLSFQGSYNYRLFWKLKGNRGKPTLLAWISCFILNYVSTVLFSSQGSPFYLWPTLLVLLIFTCM